MVLPEAIATFAASLRETVIAPTFAVDIVFDPEAPRASVVTVPTAVVFPSMMYALEVPVLKVDAAATVIDHY
jgi:hypothetical protein